MVGGDGHQGVRLNLALAEMKRIAVLCFFCQNLAYEL